MAFNSQYPNGVFFQSSIFQWFLYFNSSLFQCSYISISDERGKLASRYYFVRMPSVRDCFAHTDESGKLDLRYFVNTQHAMALLTLMRGGRLLGDTTLFECLASAISSLTLIRRGSSLCDTTLSQMDFRNGN
jgi:hypothetical protein